MDVQTGWIYGHRFRVLNLEFGISNVRFFHKPRAFARGGGRSQVLIDEEHRHDGRRDPTPPLPPTNRRPDGRRRARRLLPADEPATMPIIDTHQHLWDLSRFKLPWLKGAPKLNRSFLMEDYQQATAGLNVVKSVYMEVDVEPSQQAAEADYVLDLIRRGNTPMVGAVISGRPASDGFAAYLARYKDQPAIKGLRQVLHAAETPRGHCLDQRFVDGIRLLGRMGLSFDLCMRPAELGDAAKLIDACPDTAFILDHCGNASVRAKDLSGWKADIGRIAERKNVVVQGLGHRRLGRAGPLDGRRPGADRQSRAGAGSDPIASSSAATGPSARSPRPIGSGSRRSGESSPTGPDAEQKKLFHDNAIRVYRLS